MTDQVTIKAGYHSFSGFKTFVLKLGESVIPHQIDRSTLIGKSGSDQSSLLSTLRWLRLIDDEGHPSPELSSLAKEGEDKFAENLRPIIEKAYDLLSDNSIDIKKGTANQLEKRFREYGNSGSILIRAIAFFLAAAKESNIELSPHFKAPPKSKTNGATKRRTKKSTANSNEDTPPPPDPPTTDKNMVTIPIAIPNRDEGKILLPKNLTDTEWDYVSNMIKFVIDSYHKMSVNQINNNEENL